MALNIDQLKNRSKNGSTKISRSIFDIFGNCGEMKNVKKTLVFVGENEDASFSDLIALDIYFGSMFHIFCPLLG